MIDWAQVVTDMISGLIVGVILAGLGYIFINKYTQSIAFAKRMSEYGFTNASVDKQSKRELREMFSHASVIKLMNVSGLHFLEANRSQVKSALERGCEIRFLCCRPDSGFLADIENLECSTLGANGLPLRDKESKISEEVVALSKEFVESGMNVRFYSTEYRLPYVIAEYPEDGCTKGDRQGDEYPKGDVKVWLTMTLPPYKSTRAFVLRGHLKQEMTYSDDLNFVEMMETNFDTIWQHGSCDARKWLDDNGLL